MDGIRGFGESFFDRVLRDVLWGALRELGVVEWIVCVIKAMYEKSATVIRHNGRESKEFLVTVGVHQGSVLSQPTSYWWRSCRGGKGVWKRKV